MPLTPAQEALLSRRIESDARKSLRSDMRSSGGVGLGSSAGRTLGADVREAVQRGDHCHYGAPKQRGS